MQLPEPTPIIAASALDHYSRPLAALLADPGVTEVCLQRPGEVLIESVKGWSRRSVPWATNAWARHFARLVATATDQRVGAASPLLSAALPTGERVQVVLPPATSADRVVIAIRRPNSTTWSLRELGDGGLFADCRMAADGANNVQAQLEKLFSTTDWQGFLSLAVRARLNIVVSGATGSGKTTLTKALICEIPEDERLISIEDAAELRFERHANVVRLFYSKDDQGVARVSPKQLLEASLRLRPDRILLAELRGEEAYYFLRNVSSGHLARLPAFTRAARHSHLNSSHCWSRKVRPAAKWPRRHSSVAAADHRRHRSLRTPFRRAPGTGGVVARCQSGIGGEPARPPASPPCGDGHRRD